MTVQNINTSTPSNEGLIIPLTLDDYDHLSIMLRRLAAILATTGTEDAMELDSELVITNIDTCEELTGKPAIS